MNQFKECKNCGEKFEKKKLESKTYWVIKRFCSQLCASNNEEIKKMRYTQERNQNISKKLQKHYTHNSGWRKNKTWEEIYGEEKSRELKKKVGTAFSIANKGKYRNGTLGMKFPKEEYPNQGMRNKHHSSISKEKMSLSRKGETPKWMEDKIKKEIARQKVIVACKKGKTGFRAGNKINLGRPSWNKNKKMGEDYRKTCRERLLRLYKEGTIKPPFLGQKRSEETIQKIIKSLHLKPNKFELFCDQLFKRHNLPLLFVGDGKNKQFIIGGKIPDFVSTNESKMIVEVFYDYFKIQNYGSIENYIIQRREHFAKYGYTTLFFTYKEIKSQQDVVISKIKEVIKEKVIISNEPIG